MGENLHRGQFKSDSSCLSQHWLSGAWGRGREISPAVCALSSGLSWDGEVKSHPEVDSV